MKWIVVLWIVIWLIVDFFSFLKVVIRKKFNLRFAKYNDLQDFNSTKFASTGFTNDQKVTSARKYLRIFLNVRF